MAMIEMTTMPLIFGLDFNNSMILPAVIALAAAFMLIGARRSRRSGGSSREDLQRQIPSLREQMDMRANLEKLISDLETLSRQINAHIDTRFCKLEVLLKEADDKIRRLEALKSGKAVPASDTSRDSESDPLKQMVYKLADAGRTPVEIAREVNKDTGEVELILSLRRSRNGSPRIDYRIDS
jgi:septal ring factor EnvC (AmiA/AmiB activator)